MAADTGNGATLTMSDGFTANIYMIGGTDQTIEALEDSHLGTTTKKSKIPSDLYDAGEFECEIEHSQSTRPSIGTVITATITYPVPSGSSNGGTMTGTGFVTKRGTPELRNGQIMRGSYTFTWDGKTGPSFTSPS